MKRVLGIALLAVSMVAYGAAAKTTIKVMSGNVSAAMLNPVIAAFEKEHPTIKVNLILASYDTVDDKFLTMCVGGQAPDILMNSGVMGWARYVRQGLFADLNPFMVRDKAELDLADFPQRVLDAYKAKGKQNMLPYEQTFPYSILYNGSMLATAGLPIPTVDWSSSEWTFDDMVRYAKKLTRVGSDGKATQYGIDFWTLDLPPGWSWSAGGDWYDQESYKTGVVNKVILNSPENLKMYSRIAELYTVHKVRPGSQGNVSAAIEGFKDGKVGMWWYPQSLHNPKDYKKDFKWGLAPMPTPEGGNRGGFSWVNGTTITRASKHPQEAWEFVKYLTTRGLTKGYEFPSRTIKTKRYFEALEWWPMELCSNTKAELRTFITGAVKAAKGNPRDIIFPSQAVVAATSKYLDPAFLGKADMAQALAQAQRVAEIEVKKMVRAK